MRFLRTICTAAFVLTIPAFITFQVAARPMLSCGEDPCEMLIQLMSCQSPAGQASASEPAAVVSSCSSEDLSTPAAGGCCKSDQEPSPRAERGGSEAANHPCGRGAATDHEGRCPEGLPLCALCPLAPVAVEPAPGLNLRSAPDPTLHAVNIPALFAEALHGPQVIYSHAPPLSALARAGPERRLQICSFLL